VKTRRLLRAASLPRPVVQYSLGRFRLDFAWPQFRVSVECDGFERHGSRLQWKRDRRRVAAIEAMGWRLVHLTWDDVTRRSSESVERVALALAASAAWS
jgi:very-short-patch-repair endonuclease